MVRYTVWFELRINYAQKAVVVHSQGVINALPIPIKKNVYNDEIVMFFSCHLQLETYLPTFRLEALAILTKHLKISF